MKTKIGLYKWLIRNIAVIILMTINMAACAEGILFVESDKLWYFDASSNALIERMQLENECLSASDGKTMFCWTNEGIQVFNAEGDCINSIPIHTSAVVQQIQVSGEWIYALIENCIYRINVMNVEEMELLSVEEWHNEGINYIAAQDDILLAYTQNADHLLGEEWGIISTIDLETQSLVCAPVAMCEEYVQILPVGEIGGEPYACAARTYDEWTDRQLLLLNLRTGAKHLLAEFPAMSEGSEFNIHSIYEAAPQRWAEEATGLWIEGGEICTLDAKSQQIVKVSLELPEEEQLVIYNCVDSESERFEAAVQRFHQRYPGMKVVCRTDTQDSISRRMRDGVQGYDIQITNWGEGGWYAANAALGTYADLRESADIMAALDKWEPLIVHDEELYGVVYQLSPTPWLVNEALLAEMGLAVPAEDWTWVDLLDLAQPIREYNAQHETGYVLLMDSSISYSSLLEQYSASIADGIDGELLSAMERWVQLCREGLIVGMDGEITEDEALFVPYECAWLNMLQTGAFVAPPRGTGNAYDGGVMRALVNTRSEHLEEAMYFVACLTDPDVMKAEPEFSYGLVRDVDTSGLRISEENLALWRRLTAETDDRYVGGMYWWEMRDAWSLLMSGDMTVQEFLQQYQAGVQQRMELWSNP